MSILQLTIREIDLRNCDFNGHILFKLVLKKAQIILKMLTYMNRTVNRNLICYAYRNSKIRDGSNMWKRSLMDDNCHTICDKSMVQCLRGSGNGAN